MKIAGIICEYNPFHRGHAWQLAELRRRFGDDLAVVCAMSGDFVQRGEPALLRSHARAEAAVRGGADLVLELPLPWCASSAEGFARGGVSVLVQTGLVELLAFGSECGETEPLLRIARALESDEFPPRLRASLASGASFAAARAAAVKDLLGEEAAAPLDAPNDLLAVEYLRALARRRSAITPLALPRRGAAHDAAPSADGFASASYLRSLLARGEDASPFLMPESAAIYAREAAAGRAPVTMQRLERALLSALRRMGEEDFAPFDGGGEGLYHRFFDAVQSAPTLDALLSNAKTKRYAYARLRRMALAAFLDLPADAAAQEVPYLRVLAFNARGQALLRAMKQTARVPLLTKSADVSALGEEARRIFALTARARDQFVLAYPDLAAAAGGSVWTEGPVRV